MPIVARDISEVTERISEAIEDSFSRRQIRRLGDFLADRIRSRAARGFGVARDFGRESRLKPLSPRYIRYREKKRGKLAAWTNPRTSNVTFTGEMLSEFKAIQSRDGLVTLGFRRHSTGQKAVWNHQGGRPWTNISNKEYREAIDFADEMVERSFRVHRL
jgi:hypothetical protein